MKFDINPIKARDIGTEILGNPDKEVHFVSNISNADLDCLVFFASTDAETLKGIEAGIILADRNLKNELASFNASCIVLCENPMYEFTRILSTTYKNTFTGNMRQKFTSGKIKVADNSYIEQKVKIGEDTEIYPYVSVFDSTEIGSRCRIQSFTSIGTIGLAYARNGGKYSRFTHLGGVVIGDDVDIGANVTVVKGILQNTVIGSGTKISNNVNIGHNVEIGENCFISAGVTISGSVKIEDNCWIATGASILNKVVIRENTRIGIGSVVSKDTDKDSVYVGNPARKVAAREE